MIRHILIPSDGSKFSAKAIEPGIELAKALGAKVTAVHVVPPFHAFTYRAQMLLSYRMALSDDSEAGYMAATHACAQDILAAVKRIAVANRVPCDTVQVSDDQPFAAIIATAKKKRCDLIVMASHGRSGVAGTLLGSEANKVLTHSHVPVLICR